MKHQYQEMKGLIPDQLIWLLGFAALIGEGDARWVSVWTWEPCSRCKSMKYSGSEGCSINLATLTFFNLDWQVNCQDGGILSSSRFLSILLWGRVALHHVCQWELYWRTLRADWMAGRTLMCMEEGCVCGSGWYWASGVYVLNLSFLVANKPWLQSANAFESVPSAELLCAG